MREISCSAKLFVDLDGTAAEWHSASRYEDLFNEGYFLKLNPYKEVVEAVGQIYNSGVEVFTLSAYLTESKYALEEKSRWISKHLPFVDTLHRLFVPQDIIKSDYVSAVLGTSIGSDFYLLDDYSKNLHEWKHAGGTGIKLLNGVNGTNGSWKGHSVSRFQDGDELCREILQKISPQGIR